MRRLVDSDHQARFLTFACDKHRPLLANPWARDIVVDHLALCRDRLKFELYSWCVMPDHVHLLIWPDDEVAAVSRILSALKTRMSTKILDRLRSSGSTPPERLWQPGGGYDRFVRGGRDMNKIIEYIEWNPVKAGLANEPRDYSWCASGCDLVPLDEWW